MGNQIRLIIYAVAVVAIIGGGVYIYYSVYNKGKQSEIVKQEKQLRDLEDKTDGPKNDAITAPDPNNELRKDARPD